MFRKLIRRPPLFLRLLTEAVSIPEAPTNASLAPEVVVVAPETAVEAAPAPDSYGRLSFALPQAFASCGLGAAKAYGTGPGSVRCSPEPPPGLRTSALATCIFGE